MSEINELDAQFALAQADVKELLERPDNLTLLHLYALYKQASLGDVHGDKPGFADIAGKIQIRRVERARGHAAGRRKAAIYRAGGVAEKR